MKILLDTHCWLWWNESPERLGSKARSLIADPDTVVFLSAVNSWEIAIKYALGKLQLPEDPETFVLKRIVRDQLRPLPIEPRHALQVAWLPMHHGDPFDRLLIAQAQVEALPILTADRQFLAYDVQVIPAG